MVSWLLKSDVRSCLKAYMPDKHVYVSYCVSDFLENKVKLRKIQDGVVGLFYVNVNSN